MLKDFVGLTTNAEDLQTLINTVQGFCNKWRLKSDIKKSAIMTDRTNRLTPPPPTRHGVIIIQEVMMG